MQVFDPLDFDPSTAAPSSAVSARTGEGIDAWCDWFVNIATRRSVPA